ncbi:putative nuclease HARBI1 [Ischnura elegans]|uniref:putative nuclease HARBI1 n=1 Tax=Ischnura elegans TaxID=197161 RepID=UPI001ED883DC|nr:putative nuclease HARBI1 [Ischnura elegans]
MQVMAALRFFAGGPYQSYRGEEEYTAMDQLSMSRCISEVAKANYENMMDHWIKLDLSPESVAGLHEGFYHKYGFPGAIGALDCAHVAIVAPPVDNPIYMKRQYYNHKGYHSINVQLVCDSNMRILNVNARFPGATNDAYIYANSKLRWGLLQMKERYNFND